MGSPAVQFPMNVSVQMLFAVVAHRLFRFAAAEVDPADFPRNMAQEFRDLFHPLIDDHDRTADDERDVIVRGKEWSLFLHAQTACFRPENAVLHQRFPSVPADREDRVQSLVQESETGTVMIHASEKVPGQGSVFRILMGSGIGGDRNGIPLFQMSPEQSLRGCDRIEPVGVKDDPAAVAKDFVRNLPDEFAEQSHCLNILFQGFLYGMGFVPDLRFLQEFADIVPRIPDMNCRRKKSGAGLAQSAAPFDRADGDI